MQNLKSFGSAVLFRGWFFKFISIDCFVLETKIRFFNSFIRTWSVSLTL